MKKKLLAIALMGLSYSAHAIMIESGDFDAGSTLITFDELAAGTVVDDEYASLGLNISGTLGNNGTGAATDITVENTGGSYSDPMYIGQPNNGWDGSIILDFSGLYVTQFGAMNVDSLGSWLSVYDESDNLIETIFGNGSTYDFMGIDTEGTNISYAIFSGDFYAIDNVMFNGVSVPEPATLGLLALGLAGLGASRRKQKA